MAKVEVVCSKCGVSVFRKTSEVVSGKPGYCSRSCAASANNQGRARNPRVKRTCTRCNATFTKAWADGKGAHTPGQCPKCSEAYTAEHDKYLGQYRDFIEQLKERRSA
jgi:hypothetical protein